MFLNDFDSLFEKFSIMTIDGKLSDIEAFKILKDSTTPELYEELLCKIKELAIG